jgi:hypothetical protein
VDRVAAYSEPFTNPVLLRSPWWIRTLECLALAGGAVILAGEKFSAST